MTNPIIYTNPEIEAGAHPGYQVELPHGFGPLPAEATNKRIFYFDIDNCLYHRSTKIHDMMQVKIHQYFVDHLKVDDEKAHELHNTYYRTYGLALEGLVRNHDVDALEYNAQVDDALDLKSVLHYSPELRQMLFDIKQSGQFDYLWLITNAYKNHALRVISFLGLGDVFDGLTYCDYSQSPIVCKPMRGFFENCLQTTQITDAAHLQNLYFVDDSTINVKAAHDIGYGHVFHFVEEDADLEALQAQSDFSRYYGAGDNKDPSKIVILRSILHLSKHLGL